VAFSPVSSAAPNRKLDFLLRFFDMNEAAFAYHRHCLSDEEINRTFLSTMDFVADELFDEGVKTNPSVKPDEIKTKILERRYALQYKLDNAHMKKGCQSKDSRMGQAHYNEFSHFDRAQIGDFITERTQ
jgi:hypothetical protein